uniref:Uncharacterized protein n=1 Tax=Fagus sylvatica TaxID=28930 RepID=A0A2N9EI46_FAGSY
MSSSNEIQPNPKEISSLQETETPVSEAKPTLETPNTTPNNINNSATIDPNSTIHFQRVKKSQNNLKQIEVDFSELKKVSESVRLDQLQLQLQRLRNMLDNEKDKVPMRSSKTAGRLPEIHKEIMKFKQQISSLQKLSKTLSQSADLKTSNGSNGHSAVDGLVNVHNTDSFISSSFYKEIEVIFYDLDRTKQFLLSCFAVLPENAVVHRRLLIYWGVGEGLIDTDKEKENMPEKIVDGFLEEFEEKGLIEPVLKKRKQQVKSYKMDPLVRSAVIMLSEEEIFLLMILRGMSCQIPPPNLTGRSYPDLELALLAKMKNPKVGKTNDPNSAQMNDSNTANKKDSNTAQKTNDSNAAQTNGSNSTKTKDQNAAKMKDPNAVEWHAQQSVDLGPQGVSQSGGAFRGDNQTHQLEYPNQKIKRTQRSKTKMPEVIEPEDVIDKLPKQLKMDLQYLQCFPTKMPKVIKPEDVIDKLPNKLEKLDLECFPNHLSTWLTPKDLPNLEKLYIRGGDLATLDKSKWLKVKSLRLKFLRELKMTWIELKDTFPDLVYLEKVNCPRISLCPCDENGVWMKPDDHHIKSVIETSQKYQRGLVDVLFSTGCGKVANGGGDCYVRFVC